jgi:LysM repeat protein
MGYWGWRRLVAVFVSVWIAGCSATHDSAPTIHPTLPPRVTLAVRAPVTPSPTARPVFPAPTTAPFVSPTPFVYTLQAGDTLLSLSRRFGVPVGQMEAANSGLQPHMLQIGQQIIIPNPQFDPAGLPILPTATPLALPLSAPTCSETTTNTILCLGSVHNDFGLPVERVVVEVRLFDAQGRTLAEADTGIEQAIIPAGQFAPYRVLLQANWDIYAGAAVSLKSADIARDAGTRFVAPAQEETFGQWVNGRYILSASLLNDTTQALLVQRAVVTLADRDDRITGYRVAYINRWLAAGERMPLLVEIVPHIANPDVRPALYIEAQPVSNG